MLVLLALNQTALESPFGDGIAERDALVGQHHVDELVRLLAVHLARGK